MIVRSAEAVVVEGRPHIQGEDLVVLLTGATDSGEVFDATWRWPLTKIPVEVPFP